MSHFQVPRCPVCNADARFTHACKSGALLHPADLEETCQTRWLRKLSETAELPVTVMASSEHPDTVALRECRVELGQAVKRSQHNHDCSMRDSKRAWYAEQALESARAERDSYAQAAQIEADGKEMMRAERDTALAGESAALKEKQRLENEINACVRDINKQADCTLAAERERDTALADLEEARDMSASIEMQWQTALARIAELEATQVSPAMVAEFEGGKAQREKLRARIAELEQSERDSVEIIGTLSARIAELEKRCAAYERGAAEWLETRACIAQAVAALRKARNMAPGRWVDECIVAALEVLK